MSKHNINLRLYHSKIEWFATDGDVTCEITFTPDQKVVDNLNKAGSDALDSDWENM